MGHLSQRRVRCGAVEQRPVGMRDVLTREQVEPLDVDGVGVITVGTVLWAVAFVALLPFAPHLVHSGHGWWLGMCGTGALLGCYGIRYARRRRARLRSGRSG